VVQFDTKRKTLPGLDIQAFYFRETGEIRKEAWTAAAWLFLTMALLMVTSKAKPAHNGETLIDFG